MKNNRLKLFLCAVLALCFSCALTAIFAKNEADVVVSMQIGDPIMKINGVDAEIDAGRGTSPTVVNGRTMVPLRAVAEAFGGNVSWDGEKRSVTVGMHGESMEFVIDSPIVYNNGTAKMMDVAPIVLNGRTMLPVRYMAEGFDLGVAWEGTTKTVTVLRYAFDDGEYQSLMSVLPAYSGNAYVEINGNKPFFKDYEIIGGAFEYYARQDEMGRCDVCFASVDRGLMPTGKREDLSSVTPTGWHSVKYDVVAGGYLYNRCHLIAYQLAGENAEKRNLITGTRYLNIDGMLPFENAVAEYVKKTSNHVLYRVTPVFSESNLLASGVLLEAYSVEDSGEGICLCVFCYNVQPQIEIDYKTGESYQRTGGFVASTATDVYCTPTGKKYHLSAVCGGKNSKPISLEAAKSAGLTPCLKCVG